MDCVRGVPLNAIRMVCDEVCEQLFAKSIQLRTRDTIIRVQHLSVQALQHQSEGHLTDFRESLSSAIQVAQRIGLHRGPDAWPADLSDFDRAIWSKAYCNLYIWDR